MFRKPDLETYVGEDLREDVGEDLGGDLDEDLGEDLGEDLVEDSPGQGVLADCTEALNPAPNVRRQLCHQSPYHIPFDVITFPQNFPEFPQNFPEFPRLSSQNSCRAYPER